MDTGASKYIIVCVDGRMDGWLHASQANDERVFPFVYMYLLDIIILMKVKQLAILGRPRAVPHSVLH